MSHSAFTDATTVSVRINGERHDIPAEHSVAAALLNHQCHTRRSVNSSLRAPFCGMGVCFECRVEIDGVVQRSCLIRVRDGMEITSA